MAALCLNLKYNFSRMILVNMKMNFRDDQWLQYPRFVQMFVEEVFSQVKKEGPKIFLDHVTGNNLAKLASYKNVNEEDIPKFHGFFGYLNTLHQKITNGDLMVVIQIGERK